MMSALPVEEKCTFFRLDMDVSPVGLNEALSDVEP